MSHFLFKTLVLLAFLFNLSTAYAQELTFEQRQMAQAKLMPSMMKTTFTFLGDGRTLGMSYINDGDERGFQQLVGSTDDQYYTFDKFIIETKDALAPAFDAILTEAYHANTPEELADVEDRLIQTLGGNCLFSSTAH